MNVNKAQNLIRKYQGIIKQTLMELYIVSISEEMDKETYSMIMSAMTAINIIEVNDDIELPDSVIHTLGHAINLGKYYMKHLNLSDEYWDFLNTVPNKILSEI